MIPLNKEQHLGSKALIVFIIRRVFPAIIFLILVIIAVPVRDAVMNWINTSNTTALMSDQAVSAVSTAFSYIIAILFALFVIFGVFGFIISFLEYRTYTFTLEEFDLKMKRGILSRRENSIPYRQIQDVDTEQSVLYRMFGLSRLVMITAGHEEGGEKGDAEVWLEPIDTDIAEEIQAQLEREIGVQVVEGEKEADQEAKK